MSPQELDVAHLRSWIGREETANDIISQDIVRKFHATLDFPGLPPCEGDLAPRLIHFCLGQPAVPTASLGEDGHPQRGGFLPPVPLPRRMWAGGSLTFCRELRVGDTVQRISQITDVVPKEGRTGLLCFVTVEHVTRVSGHVAINETQTIVYRGLDGPEPMRDPPPAATGTWQRRVKASEALLFRYSALTFNGHRIHYDRRYVTEVEHYPGLVVHGPLQATLLLNYATELRGSAPTKFTFRSLSPIFDEGSFVLNAEGAADGTIKLWTAREDGAMGMTAEAQWQ